MANNEWIAGHSYLLRLSSDGNDKDSRTFIVEGDDGERYSVDKLKFQIGSELPEAIHCMLSTTKNGKPQFKQDIKRLIVQFYTNGEEYEFTVIEPKGYDTYKVQDDHGIFFKLTVPSGTRLAVGQRVRCVTEFNIRSDVRLRLAIFNHDSGKTLTIDELMEAVPCRDAELERWLRNIAVPSLLTHNQTDDGELVDSLTVVNLLSQANDELNKWIESQSGRLTEQRANIVVGAMEYLIALCRYLLEGCDILTVLSGETRRAERECLSHIIDDTGDRIEGFNLVRRGEHVSFISDLLNKLKVAHYIYQPERQLGILMTIFRLQPELINENMGHIFDVIRGWGLDNLKTEPFRKAFIDQLEIYINENSHQIDRLTAIESAAEASGVSQMISALAIQMLIVNPSHDNVALDINRSRLYRYLTLQGPYGKEKLLTKSRLVLATGAYGWRTEWEWNDTRQAVTLLTKCINHPAPIVESAPRVFTGRRMRVIVDGKRVEVMPLVSSNSCRDIFTEGTLPVDWLQVRLPETLQTSSLRSRGMKTRVDCWKSIERHLTTERAVAGGGNATPTASRGRWPANGQMVHVTIDSIDDRRQRLKCTVVDEGLEGEGWLNYKDILPYNISPDDNDFLFRQGQQSEQMVFNAIVMGRDAEGMLTLEMKDSVVKPFFEELAQPGQAYIAAITYKNRRNGLFSCITRQGFTMWLPITPEFEELTSGTYVEVVVDKVHEGFNIIGHITREADSSEIFDTSVPFHVLMHSIYDGTIEPEDETETDDDVVRTADDVIDAAAIRELALVLLHLAESEGDYLRGYDLVSAARLLALAIDDEPIVSNCDNHQHLIEALHDFATNKKLDSDRLEALRPAAGGSQAAWRLFNKLYAADSIGKPERLEWLLSVTRATASSSATRGSISQIAQLAISSTMLAANGITAADAEIDKQMRSLLNVGASDSPIGRYYGIEDLFTEFKASIIYPAVKAGSHIKPNPRQQLHHIMERVAGMLNALGGKLYLGVNDMGYANGLVDDFNYITSHESGEPRDKFALMVRNAIYDLLGVEAGRYVHCRWDDQSTDRPVYVLDIEPSPAVVTVDGVAWERQDSRTIELKPTQLERFRQDRKRQYDKIIRDMSDAQEEAMPADEEVVPEVAAVIGTPAPAAAPAEARAEADTVEPERRVKTAVSRPNVLHNYEDGFVDDVIGYIYFMPGGKYQIAKQDRYLEDRSELALAVHEDEENGWLVMMYEDTSVVKVPIRDILDKNEDTAYNYCSTQPLVYAIPMRPSDSLLQVVRDLKQKCYYRVDTMDDIAGGNINSDGERLCHTSTLTVLRCERVPEGLLPTFQDGRGKTHRQAGYDVRPGRDGVEQAINDLLAPLSAESKG
ncbi:MAG: ATP-binding protein [Muribaculaceae bacterium]|nr:ATP-binding protein [Muribaculaceae bacterium]